MAAGKKLLVADDSLTIQKVIRLALSNEGYEIQAISDGADAIQQISLFRPDLILVDVSLPTLSAFEIKRQINGMDDFANSRFILMSSAFEKIDEDQAKEVVFQGRLTKPFDPAHLRQVLQEVLAIPTSTRKTSTSTSINRPGSPAPVAPPSSFPNSLELEMPKQVTSPGIRLEPPSGFPDLSISSGIEPQFEDELTPPPLPEQSGLIPRKEISPSAPNAFPDHQNASHSSSHNAIDEIKHLTESTIRMSGLDDFDWTVNDSGLKPPSSLADDGGTSFQIPPQSGHTAPSHSGHSSHSTSHSSSQSSGHSSGAHHTQSASSSISSDEIEAMVRRQVQEALENMARKILPEVAERVIKAEIHKLLTEKF
jgi:two-component system cell cycle response regulator